MGSEILEQNKIVVVIDYGMGNMRSVAKAFEYLGCQTVISSNPDDIKRADYLVLPGVGSFGRGMDNLKRLNLIELLSDEVLNKKKPILGICLGMQLMADDGEEFGYHKGLGWIRFSVKKLEADGRMLKIPHVGWNNTAIKKDCFLFKGFVQDPVFYFVHSYHMVCDSDDIIAATCNYGKDFAAAVQKGNIFATQFHPEKSQILGLKLLENFINWRG